MSSDQPDPFAGTEFEGMEPEVFVLPAEQYDRLLAMLEEDPKPVPKLEELFRRAGLRGPQDRLP